MSMDAYCGYLCIPVYNRRKIATTLTCLFGRALSIYFKAFSGGGKIFKDYDIWRSVKLSLRYFLIIYTLIHMIVLTRIENRIIGALFHRLW